ncbi:MAG: ureidoglycolate lyase [Amylibacter sp.]|jgi:ureidoglycolate lyase|nr:ureidoglycolate lyase [Amylibacter sp.]MDC0604878.1 ureidoglycolate lyase [Amylibacter sp.]MDC0982736.1 ureidoglycolate lyase [Amylibacter sp.]
MIYELQTQPLTTNAFKAFGEIIDATGEPDKIINQGLCGRYHNLAQLDFTTGKAGLSVFNAEARSLPFKLEMMERHPEGSQAFIPMHQYPFLIIVSHDKNGVPDTPISFISKPGQGINIFKNTWHGVLCPLHSPGLFAVIDRIGEGPNLEEHWFKKVWTII